MSRVLLPVAQEVVAREVGLVAGRDERGEPEPAARGLGDRRDPERAALRGERDPAAARRDGREGRVETDVRGGVEDAEAVRADEPHARRRGRRPAARPAAARPSAPTSAKPADSTTSARTPGVAALARDTRDGVRRHGDRRRDRRARARRRSPDSAGRPAISPALGCTTCSGPREAGGEQVRQQRRPDGALMARGADQRDRCRPQHVPDGRDGGRSGRGPRTPRSPPRRARRAARTPATPGPSSRSTGKPESRNTCAIR